MLTIDHAWKLVSKIPDPEIPVISVTELGIVRDISMHNNRWVVIVTPTYIGCPATEVIQTSIKNALLQAGAQQVDIKVIISPPWNTEWITPDAKHKLKRHGIAAPLGCQSIIKEEQIIYFRKQNKNKIACPRCDRETTHCISEFGSTACKSLYKCLSCLEPFEYFKVI